MMTSLVSVGTGSTYNSATIKDNPVISVLVFISAKNDRIGIHITDKVFNDVILAESCRA